MILRRSSAACPLRGRHAAHQSGNQTALSVGNRRTRCATPWIKRTRSCTETGERYIFLTVKSPKRRGQKSQSVTIQGWSILSPSPRRTTRTWPWSATRSRSSCITRQTEQNPCRRSISLIIPFRHTRGDGGNAKSMALGDVIVTPRDKHRIRCYIVPIVLILALADSRASIT